MDNKRRLEGIISLKDLVLADGEKKVEDLMKTEFVSVDTHDHREDIGTSLRNMICYRFRWWIRNKD